MSKFERLKPFPSGVSAFLKEAVEQPYFLTKNTIFILNILYYVHFDITFSGITPVYTNVILKS